MLFKLEKDVPVLESNPQFKLFEEFTSCTDRQLRYIALYCDYDTPLRNLPLKERREYAADMAGYRREKDGRLDKNARQETGGGKETVVNAIKKYQSLQYDQEKELLQALSIQIDQVIELMKKIDKKEDDWDLINKLSPKLPQMISQKKELEVLVGYRDKDQSEDLEGEPLSALDMFHEGKL